MKKQVSPRIAAIVIIVVLAVVQGAYWRVLVYTPRNLAPPPKGMGKAPMTGNPFPVGLDQVQVSTYVGEPAPGYRDGDLIEARFNGPAALATRPDGTILVADTRNHRIRAVTPEGLVRTIAGTGPTGTQSGGFADGPAASARFSSPCGLAVRPDGGVYVADTGNHKIRLLTPEGTVTTVAASFRYPSALALDRAGNLYIADTGNGCVRKMSPDGVVSTLPRLANASGHRFELLPENTYNPAGSEPMQFPIREVAASGLRSRPTGLAVTDSGVIYVADSGNQCVWRLKAGAAPDYLIPPPITPEDTGRGDRALKPVGVLLDRDGLLVTDTMTHCLLGADEYGTTLLAGVYMPNALGRYADEGGNRAGFATPSGLARRGETVFVADFGNHCIRRITGIP